MQRSERTKERADNVVTLSKQIYRIITERLVVGVADCSGIGACVHA